MNGFKYKRQKNKHSKFKNAGYSRAVMDMPSFRLNTKEDLSTLFTVPSVLQILTNN